MPLLKLGTDFLLLAKKNRGFRFCGRGTVGYAMSSALQCLALPHSTALLLGGAWPGELFWGRGRQSDSDSLRGCWV